MEIEPHIDYAAELWKLRMIPAHYLVPNLFFQVEYDIRIDQTDRRKRRPMIHDYYFLITRCAKEIWKSKFMEADNLKVYLARIRSHYLKHHTYKKEFAKLFFRKNEMMIGGVYAAGDGCDAIDEIVPRISRGEVFGVKAVSEVRDKIEIKLGDVEARPPMPCLTGLTNLMFSSISSLLTPEMDLQWLEAALSYCMTKDIGLMPKSIRNNAKAWVVEVTAHPTRRSARGVIKLGGINPKETYHVTCTSENMREVYTYLANLLSDVYQPLELAGMESLSIRCLYPVMKHGTQIDLFKDMMESSQVTDEVRKILLIGQKGIGKSNIIKNAVLNEHIYVDDSDDYGKFLTWWSGKRGVSIMNLGINIGPNDVVEAAYEFAGVEKEHIKSAINVQVEKFVMDELEKGQTPMAVLEKRQIPLKVYTDLMLQKTINPSYYERGLLHYMNEKKETLLLQFSHVLSDNYARMGYGAAFDLVGSFGTTSNLIARTLLNKGTSVELIADLLLNDFYLNASQPVGYRLEIGQVVDLYGKEYTISSIAESK